MGKTNKNIDNMEICDYMKYLNANIWDYLFEDALAHETIFSSLSELEQIIISRLLFVQQVVSERAMRLWINPSCLKRLSEGIKNLVQVKILIGSEMKKDNYFQYKMNDKFRFTLLNKIYRNKENNVFIFNNNIQEQLEKEKELYEKKLFPTKEDIFQHTQAKWNALLHFIASPHKNNINTYEENWEYDRQTLQSNDVATRHSYGSKRETKKKNKNWGIGENESTNGMEEAEFDEETFLYDDVIETDEVECSEENEEAEYETENETEFANSYNEMENNIHEKINEYENKSNYNQMKNRKKKKKTKINQNCYSSINPIKYKQLKIGQMNTYYNENNTPIQNQSNLYAIREEENNINSNGIVSFKNETQKEVLSSKTLKMTNIPSDSVIEILKRKNFISKESNKYKVISMSREAFSWFLKDLRSRIISLVLEYLLVIDGGYVTNIAKEVFSNYEKKKDLERGKKKEMMHTDNIGNNTIGNSDNNYNNTNYSNDFSYNNSENKSLIETSKKLNSKEISYAAQSNKDAKRSEIYVKETLLLILSLSQCNICQPLFLNNLTKAQKEFINFGSHIGLFYKKNENVIFITPYALLLNTNNTNTQHYMSLLNNLSIEGLCDSKFKRNLSEKYFHKYMLFQEKDKENIKNSVKGIKNESSLRLQKAEETVTEIAVVPSFQLKPSINNLIDKNSDNNNLEIGLIVQSNFKVYLYTSSLLKINILSHLCELQARLPNMVVGLLTRKSVLNAFTSGITANQIIKFLESYSHPFNKNSKSTIPNNVIAQLKLWESERHRLTFEDAVVFKSWEKEFLPYLYQQIVIWANNKNYLLYYTPWPKNNTKEFENWMKIEKYLCCIYESKNEIIEKIKEIREVLLKKKKKE